MYTYVYIYIYIYMYIYMYIYIYECRRLCGAGNHKVFDWFSMISWRGHSEHCRDFFQIMYEKQSQLKYDQTRYRVRGHLALRGWFWIENLSELVGTQPGALKLVIWLILIENWSNAIWRQIGALEPIMWLILTWDLIKCGENPAWSSIGHHLIDSLFIYYEIG